MSLNPFSVIAAKIYGALAIGAIVVAGAQTLRIEGALCRDAAAGEYSKCVITGFRQQVSDRDLKIDDLTVKLFAESAAHRQTKIDYRVAQENAAELEQARLARVKAQQQEITHDIVADYRRRLADARARAEQLRGETAGAGERAGGAADRERVPAAGDAAGRADEAPGDRGLPLAPANDLDWRLTATEQAIQLNALIDWVAQQFAVPVNGERP